jgi:hypothetical protein
MKFQSLILALPVLLPLPLSFSLHAQTITGVRAADASCRRCHEKVVDSYLATPMANASGRAIDNAKEGAFKKEPSGAEYQLQLSGAQLFLKSTQSSPPLTESRRLEYFLGSGHLGTTYLYSLNRYLLESPVAFYAASGHLDMKPGIASTGQIAAALPVRPACLRCHMSAVQPSDAGTMNRYQGPAFLHTGITCEECHGSSVEHVATGGKSPVVNPAKLDEEKRDSVCISCHLEGDVAVEKARHSALDYLPGNSISDYLSYFVFSGKDPTRRGVSEVEQLTQSVCKQSSGAKMSCSSCHDPHATPAAQDRVQFYRGKCLACHHDVPIAVTHYPENPDCTSCHMPRTGSENIPHVAWTDHRILKRPQRQSPDLLSSEVDNLTAIFSPSATSRDLGLAFYNASFNGKQQLQAKAYSILKAHEEELPGDPEALDALGTLTAARGDFAEATLLYQKVLKINPSDFTASTNLGTLFAKTGNLSQAIDLWQPVFGRNQDIPGLGENLALAQCLQGDPVAAKATLDSILIFSPGLVRAQQALALLPKCGSGRR